MLAPVDSSAHAQASGPSSGGRKSHISDPVLRKCAQWLARKFDAGFRTGRLLVTLPDATRIAIGGHAPGFDAALNFSRWRAIWRLVTGGSVGLYQAWEKGEWSSPAPVDLFALVMVNATHMGKLARPRGPWRLAGRLAHLARRNSRAGSLRNIHAHYDLGNDFYQAWLDRDLVYSSARFSETEQDLESAQQAKLRFMAGRLAGAGSVLEIGCGWGALAQMLHQQGAEVTAISLSQAQLDWARANRDPAIRFAKCDYRDVQGQFDAIASVEMVEAVGQEYWPDFFDCLDRCLKPGGRAAIQYIAIREDLFAAYARAADFIQTYIFPGGMLVSEAAFRRLARERGLVWEEEVHFPQDYARTLRIWRERFDRAAREGRLPAQFDGRFQALWRFYLTYCEGGFVGGGITVAQVTLRKP